jgi:uncharacterized Fe-S cluster protein YjdI/CDGSH-type Zn-finger protein
VKNLSSPTCAPAIAFFRERGELPRRLMESDSPVAAMLTGIEMARRYDWTVGTRPRRDTEATSVSDKVQEYRGERIVIRFDGHKCIHSRNCVLGRPDVFVPNAPGGWIYPDNAPPEAVAEIAHNCPSGAISYERFDAGPQAAAPIVNVVRIRKNGPLAFHAKLQIEGRGNTHRATLCRCEASKNKPLCDGAHRAASAKA